MLALACATTYAVVLVVPYYVNGMDQFPLEDVAIGYHDPKDLWPYDTGLAYFFEMGGLLIVRFGVLAVLTALVWSVVLLVRYRTSLGSFRRGALRLAVVVALATLVWRASTFGQALTRWWLD